MKRKANARATEEIAQQNGGRILKYIYTHIGGGGKRPAVVQRRKGINA